MVPRNIYSARSVDSRGFFCFSMMVGYPTIIEKQKKNRESTDLEEYIVLVCLNFQNRSVVAKLQPPEVWKKSAPPEKKSFRFVSPKRLSVDGRVPYHHGKTEKTSGIDRSRRVHISRYQKLYATPNTPKVMFV